MCNVYDSEPPPSPLLTSDHVLDLLLEAVVALVPRAPHLAPLLPTLGTLPRAVRLGDVARALLQTGLEILRRFTDISR